MNYQVVNKNCLTYIECLDSAIPIQDEQGALDLVALCGENDTSLLLINAEILPKDFFDLKTGVAGQILQKFVNYHIKTALIIPDETNIKGRFKEMINESNRGSTFRVFENHTAAEQWLLDIESPI